MSFRLASAAVVVVAMAQVACESGDEVLVATIQLEPGTPATCISLTVSEPDTAPARLLSETHVVRAAGQNEYRMAVYRSGLPAEVVLAAHALNGNGCASPLSHVSSSAPARHPFVRGAPGSVSLSIPRPLPAPEALEFRPMAPVLYAGACASAAVQTTLDGGVVPVHEDTAISFSVEPDAGLTTHTDGACAAPAGGGVLSMGSSVLPLQLRALAEGQYTVTASAAGLDSGTIVLTVQLSPPSTIAFSSAPTMALSGACVGPVRLRPEDGSGNPSLLAMDTIVNLSATAPGVTFATDAQCTTTTSNLLLRAGTPEVLFYFRARGGGAVTLRASAGSLGMATQAQQIVPTVRTGSCVMNAGTAAIACPLPQPVFDLSKAFLVVQAISNDNNPAGANVRCRLAEAGAIDCSRNGTSGTVDVAWHVVELPSGIRVQRVDNAQCPGNLITVPQPFDPAKTFVLFTAESPGATIDANDYRMVRLVGNNQVEVLNDTGCGNATMDVQVIELEGASVERGTLAAASTPVTVTTTSSVDLTRSFLLHSARFTGAAALCPYQLRGTLGSPNTITFTRGDGNAACQTPEITAIAWERVRLPPGAISQQAEVSMIDGQSSASATISPVDPARSFAFSSSQFNAGAGFGETSFNGDDQPGAAGARHGLSAGSRLELTRSVASGTARWTSYVVELP